MTLPQVRGMYNGDRSRKKVLVEYGFRLPSALDNRPLRFEEFEKLVQQVHLYLGHPGADTNWRIAQPGGGTDHPPDRAGGPGGGGASDAEGQVDDLLERSGAHRIAGERVLVTTLTKRMAEDLAEYLTELGIKVQYLHSEIETHGADGDSAGPAHGEFDVLVGINLLREGLDLPEVSLVAILDADKEGFPARRTQLIQTTGGRRATSTARSCSMPTP